MAYNTQEERFVVKGSERITHDLQVNGDTYIIGDLSVSNIIANESIGTDGQVLGKSNGNIEWINASSSIDTNNLEVNNLIVNENATFNTIIANGVSGNDGQVLGKVNGNIEWMNVSANIDTDNFSVNNLIVNENAIFNTIIANGTVGNDGQVLGKVNGNIEWVDSSAIDTNNLSVNYLTVNESAKINGYDVTSYTVIEEDNYNYLSRAVKSKPILYMTTPNGNLYFQGYGYAPSILPPAFYEVYVNLYNLENNIENHTLYLRTPVLSNGSSSYMSVYGIKENGVWNNSADINTHTTGYNNLNTMANELYIYNAGKMYFGCKNLKDTFICNQSLIVNMAEPYDLMKYCVNMDFMFSGCTNFNQPINIPSQIQKLHLTFEDCTNFNQSLDLNNVKNFYRTFHNSGFNQPLSLTGIINFAGALSACKNFNQPINIISSTTHGSIDVSEAFRACKNFNQPVNITAYQANMSNLFFDCTNFNQPFEFRAYVPRDVSGLFYNCKNYNQPFTIRLAGGRYNTGFDNVFYECINFNQPVTIKSTGGGIDGMNYTFAYSGFNSDIIFHDDYDNVDLPFSNFSGVKYMYGTFQNCHNLDHIINIPNTVTGAAFLYANSGIKGEPICPDNITDAVGMYYGCYNLTGNAIIGPNVSGALSVNSGWPAFVTTNGMYQGCYNLDGDAYIYSTQLEGNAMGNAFGNCRGLHNVHIRSSLNPANTDNAIVNALLNGITGINWTGRIFNDL